LLKNYQDNIAPDENTVVFTDFNYANFREVDDKKMVITFDVLIGYFWRDNRIRKAFAFGVEPIREEHKNRIWKPSPYIANLKSYHQRSSENKIRLEQLSVFNDPQVSRNLGYNVSETQALVAYRVETQIKLYCNFMFESYPMDTQKCLFSLGSSDLDTDRNVAFSLWMNGMPCFKYNDTRQIGHALQDFEVETNCYSTHGSSRTMRSLTSSEKDWVAFNITLKRILRPFLMKYYLPSAAIVISSQISFIIPMTAIPGRTALLATLFLAQINIFTTQQV
jgi:hypothetical protein